MKKAITAFALASIMTLGTTFAHGGIIVAGRPDTGNTNCQTQREGIIVAGLTGIIVAGLTGIIVAGKTGTEVTPCSEPLMQDEGIIVAGRDGIIVAG